MANYEDTRYNINGSNLQNVQGVNTGLIIPWGSASIPSGFLECNGASISTTTYASLFAIIGYTYGGSGASFLLPDLQDKTVLSKSNTKAIATTGGANTVTPTGNISATAANTTLTSAEIPSHSHTFTTGSGASGIGGNNGVNPSNSNTGNTGGGGAHNHTVTANFSGSATSVLQPYLTLIYIIKT